MYIVALHAVDGLDSFLLPSFPDVVNYCIYSFFPLLFPQMNKVIKEASHIHSENFQLRQEVNISLHLYYL